MADPIRFTEQRETINKLEELLANITRTRKGCDEAKLIVGFSSGILQIFTNENPIFEVFGTAGELAIMLHKNAKISKLLKEAKETIKKSDIVNSKIIDAKVPSEASLSIELSVALLKIVLCVLKGIYLLRSRYRSANVRTDFWGYTLLIFSLICTILPMNESSEEQQLQNAIDELKKEINGAVKEFSNNLPGPV